VELCQGQNFAAAAERAREQKGCNYGQLAGRVAKVAIAGLAAAMDDVDVGQEDSLVW